MTTRSGTVKHGLMSDLMAADIRRRAAHEDVVAAFTYGTTSSRPSNGSQFTVVYETARSKAGAAHVDVCVSPQHRVYRYETNDTRTFMEDGRGVAPFRLGAPCTTRR